MSALFPDVPVFPGVPPVLRDAVSAISDFVPQLTADNANLTTDLAPVWGIFDADGNLVIDPDSIVAIDYGKEEQISSFPVERGSFQSYNKVETPYSLRVTMTKGGSIGEREAFLQDCNDLRASIDLFSVVTPEETYENGNVTRVGKVRNAQSGAQLLTVEMVVEEVRTSATSQFTQSNVKDPASADATNDGAVQPKDPTAAQTPPGQPV